MPYYLLSKNICTKIKIYTTNLNISMHINNKTDISIFLHCIKLFLLDHKYKQKRVSCFKVDNYK